MTTDADEVAYYKPLLLNYRDTVNMVNRDDPLTVCVNSCEIEKAAGTSRRPSTGCCSSASRTATW